LTLALHLVPYGAFLGAVLVYACGKHMPQFGPLLVISIKGKA
jgi:hypothetical protein